MMRARVGYITPVVVFVVLAGAPARLGFAEGITRVQGRVVDNHGKPLAKVPIYFEAADVKKRVGPVRTNKEGAYIIATLDITVAHKWKVIPELNGYKTVKVSYEIVDSERKERGKADLILGSKQEFPEIAFALIGDAGRNFVDFVLATDSEFIAAVQAERKNRDAAASAGAPAGAGEEAAAPAAAKPEEPVVGAPKAPLAEAQNLERAKQLTDAGRHAEAIELYRAYLAKDPTGNPAVYYYLGRSLFESGDSGAAEQAFRKGLELKPDMKGGHFFLGNIALKEERADEAVSEYEQEVKLTPDSDAVLFNLGLAYGRSGKDDQALAALGQAATLNPSKPECYMQMASIYEKRKEAARAEEMYQKVQAIDPRNAAILFYNVGVRAWNENRNQDAAQAYRKAIEIDPDYAVTHRELARALMGLQDFTGALRHFQEYLRLNPKAADAKEIQESIAFLKK